MLDPLTTVEIQTLRLKLLAFADRQSDQTVRFQCAELDAKLAKALEGDDPILRQILANYVEQLEEAHRATIEEATVHFLTGLRRVGSRRPTAATLAAPMSRLPSVRPRSPWPGLTPLSYQFGLVTISGIVTVSCWPALLTLPARVRDNC